MVLAYPAFLQPYAAEVTMLLVFIDGLLFGLAIKKAFVSVILIMISMAIAYFLGLTFIPSLSVSTIFSNIMKYATSVQFGNLIISFSVVIFVIGLGIGLWRG